MGGSPKGLIPLASGRSGQTILEHTLRTIAAAQLDAVLVGDLDAYDALATTLGVMRIPDARGVNGPLAGLQALVQHAGTRDAVVLACDMPFVSVALLQRLATESPAAHVLAPRSGDGRKWEPLCARYRSEQVRPVLAAGIEAGEQSFQQLFARLNVTELDLDNDERRATRDWDTPEDITR